MFHPPGFEYALYPGNVCKFHKTIYRLKQVPKTWFDNLSNALCSMGFSKSKAYSYYFVIF